MASAMMERAELPVQRNRTLYLMPLCQRRSIEILRSANPSGAQKTRFGRDDDGLLCWSCYWQQVGAQQEGPMTLPRRSGLVARTKALMNLPSISGATFSTSRPAEARNSRASSIL